MAGCRPSFLHKHPVTDMDHEEEEREREKKGNGMNWIGSMCDL
jgi:hypothetical protein